MSSATIVIISGSPGSGKTTIAKQLAEQSCHSRAIHLHTDDFYDAIKKGYVLPWKTEAQQQNIVVMEAITACAKRYAEGGFETYVDGVVGPWFLNPWLKLAQKKIDVRFIVLRPNEETTIKRAVERQNPDALVKPEVVRKMWHQFSDLGKWEKYAVDSSNHTSKKTVKII